MTKIRSSDITPEQVYLSRRKFMTGVGALALLAACGRAAPESEEPPAALPVDPTLAPTEGAVAQTDELGDSFTTFEAITNYNDYYEFSTSKEAVARLAGDFPTRPWTIEVGGLVQKPRIFDIEDILRFDQEERIYRLRCVEAWSMVIPWLGFPLSRLLKEVEPLSSAKYVRFQSFYDPELMPGTLALPQYPWPYVEGLSIAEAMHDLTILSTGLYGKELLPQNGAPLRLVVPWKYGFKSIKAIVKIDLVEEMPASLWMASGYGEYGFWANVNPDVDHRRWSQATERRIGENGRRETLFFNGYADEVASLYPNLDSRDWYY
ncbi:MAG: protein-methionine-sulfoxide reductase catalytic subunit MsrP [Anaerolineae bacterium]|nr:protein-methionine-sulfoxide reductase catalytic subunit MsrP [Anaerolineae bacterium]